MTPGSTALGLTSAIILALALLFLLGGCVHVATEPGVPYPARPPLQVICRAGQCCMSAADADAFLNWILKLNEFERARAELLR